MKAPKSKKPAPVLGPLILLCPSPCHIIPFRHHPNSHPFLTSSPHLSVPIFCCSPISPPLYSLFPTSPSLLIFSLLPSPSPSFYLPCPPIFIPQTPPPLHSPLTPLPFLSSHPFTPGMPKGKTRKKTSSGDYADLPQDP